MNTGEKQMKGTKPMRNELPLAAALMLMSPLIGSAAAPPVAEKPPTTVLLASFEEGDSDAPTLTPNNGCLVKVSQEKDRVSAGASALRVEFPPTKTSVDVGVSIGCGELNDWSGASALVSDVFYEGNWDKWQWLFTTRLDANSKPLHYHGVRLTPGWNKGIVLADLVKTHDGKEIDKTIFKDVKKLYLYVQTGTERTEPLVIHVDNLRLRK
jgi:hypothetical protein